MSDLNKWFNRGQKIATGDDGSGDTGIVFVHDAATAAELAHIRRLLIDIRFILADIADMKERKWTI